MATRVADSINQVASACGNAKQKGSYHTSVLSDQPHRFFITVRHTIFGNSLKAWPTSRLASIVLPWYHFTAHPMKSVTSNRLGLHH